MGYRNIIIANPAKLTVSKNRLVIDTGEQALVPLEDIRCIMLENRQITLTSSLLTQLGEAGITVFACSRLHLPASVFYPINSHSRQLKQLRMQIEQSQPSRKRLWRQIVEMKIKNQALCLELCGLPGHENLNRMLPLIRSGDPENIEARAAAYYFKALFGKEFTRKQENITNAVLNYGYTIFRGLIARTLAIYGFEPCLGLHHKSELNNFNLADDLMEPFRPIVDLYAAKNCLDIIQLSTIEKAYLLDLINTEVYSGGEKHNTAYAVERLIKSLTACLSKQKDSLVLPMLKGLDRHEYE